MYLYFEIPLTQPDLHFPLNSDLSILPTRMHRFELIHVNVYLFISSASLLVSFFFVGAEGRGIVNNDHLFPPLCEFRQCGPDSRVNILNINYQ